MKKLIFVIATLFSITVFAKKNAVNNVPFYRAVTYLSYKDAKGKEHRDSLHVETKIVRVNALELPRALWKKGEPSIKFLTKVEPSKKMVCPKGTYTLQVAKGEKRSVKETGCVDSPRFISLEKSFKNLNDLLPKR